MDLPKAAKFRGLFLLDLPNRRCIVVAMYIDYSDTTA